MGLLLAWPHVGWPCCRADPTSDACRREREHSRRRAARVEFSLPLRGSGPDADFVRTLGARLAEYAGPVPHAWSFLLVRDDRPNAFAIGAGRIYVSEGAIGACENEAELAAMISHEMGHELAGHFCPDARRERAARSHRGLLGQRVDLAEEEAADRISIRLLRAAGYDPRAALRIATRISKLPHPGAPEMWGDGRLEALARVIAETPPGGRLDSEAFRRLRNAE